ncbi:MAG TPA: tetratricopeptide repeat protein, partial [Thermoanaerobaculia bacterium]|nr:tetratricopeptide repeat protein [Thermoanaerobaculia bacterium]
SGPLPDPKDELSLLRELHRATSLFLDRKFVEAIAGFKALHEKNPRMKDISVLYAQALKALDRNEEALEILRQGAAVSPDGVSHFALSIAEVCLKLGKLDEAEGAAAAAQKGGDPRANDVLARVYLAQKRWDDAERAAKESLAARPKARAPYLVLARVRLERNDLQAALEFVDRVRVPGEELPPEEVRNLHFVRGEILRRLGRLIEAEAELREEIRVSPGNPDAWAALAAVCAAEGRLADADSVRRAAASKFPSDRRFAR